MFTDYLEIIHDAVRGYDGKEARLIKAAPHFFDILSGLLEDVRLDRTNKPLLTAAITYFVSPYDVFPEDVHGTYGLIDDVFLAAWVLDRIGQGVNTEILQDHWRGEENLTALLDEILKRKSELVGDKLPRILAYVGLEE